MKSFLQIFLFAILIITFYFFYKSYFADNKSIERSIVERPLNETQINQEENIEQKKNLKIQKT